MDALRADLQIATDQLTRGEGIVIANEAAHNAFFDDIEKRGQMRLAGRGKGQ